MSERKYTDERIVKALECCFIDRKCTECPARYREHDCLCVRRIGEAAWEMLNRPKAAIEKLQEVNADLNESLRLAAEANKDLKAAIERLADRYMVRSDGSLELIPRTDTDKIRAEAIKEFAVRFKETASSIVGFRDGVEIYETKLYQIRATSFDNLVAEMTEGEEI